MSIGSFVLILALWAASSYVLFAVLGLRAQTSGNAQYSERTLAATIVFIPLTIALAARSLDFGVDSITYYGLFQQFCDATGTDFEASYLSTFWLLRIASFGACSPALLVPMWTVIIAVAFLVLPVKLSDRVRLAAVGMFSLVGIELATNALRQGFAAAVAMVGVAWFERNRLVGGTLLLLSIALHSSSALVVAAFGLSVLGWRLYLVGVAVIALAALNYEALTFIGPVESLVYEITKYAAHEASDFWIRVLAAAQLFTTVGIAFALAQRRGKDADEIARGNVRALKVALTALPYLAMPYFGYRYIYGIYLIVLYLARRSILDDRTIGFEALIMANVVLALAWSLGSSAILGTVFLNL